MIGDDVAIKILHFDQNESSEAERFRREAQAATKLKHAHAVSIFDFGISDEGRQYLVMELVEGESLCQLIKRQGPATPCVRSRGNQSGVRDFMRSFTPTTESPFVFARPPTPERYRG